MMLPLAGRPNREHVVLVHGYLANTLMLSYMRHRLRSLGFYTQAWGYWNMQCSIVRHAERFANDLTNLDADPVVSTIHLVTHSMGGIIARAALARFRPNKLGRFVMLAPPNRGSFVATAVGKVLGGILRPIAELSTAENSFVNSLSMPSNLEIGVIAANRDALVSLESTRPAVPHAHITLPCRHSSLLFRRDCADLVAIFLQTGLFAPQTSGGMPH